MINPLILRIMVQTDKQSGEGKKFYPKIYETLFVKYGNINP